jgi:hemolysin III
VTSAPRDGPAALLPEASARRPHLRGWSHLVAVLPWTAGTVVLTALANGHPGRQVALALYGAASVWLFGVSGLYHVVTWPPRRRALLRRLDHANIFVLVAATYTPVMLVLTGPAWGISIVVTVWVLAVAGVAISLTRIALPRWASAGLYVLLGWVSVVAMPSIAASVGLGGLFLLLAGGLLYSLGAVAYALRRPSPVPGWFGYHEVFHALVIAASGLFFAFMVIEVAPH